MNTHIKDLYHDDNILTPIKTDMTLEEFFDNDIEGYEYVKGVLIPMPAASILHGGISVRVIRYLDAHVYQNQLGDVYTAETSFRIGERVMKPDVAYVAKHRVPEDRTKGFPFPPDLAVEVISPSDILWDVSEKVLAYLDAGTCMVWLIDPVLEHMTVYRPNRAFKILRIGDTLTGEDVIEGFSCAVEKLFE